MGTTGRSYSFLADARLRIKSWGEEIAEFTGKSPSAVVGRKYYEVLPRIFSDDRDALALVLADKRTLHLKGYACNCLHDRISADVRIDPVRGARGKVEEVRVDICPYSACSMARRLQNSQRFIDIGMMAATLAHGVRNPLNAIKGSVVYLRERYAEEATLLEFTTMMEEEIARLDNFISKFLSTSEAISRLSETDVNALVRKVEIFTSLQAHARDIRTTYDYGDVPPVAADSFQLEQAVLNVVNNAIEAMGSGGRLAVRTRRSKSAGTEYVVIEVSDTGPGFSEDAVGEVPSGKGGRGFGLFITREVVRYYGGRLEIESSKGAGAVLRLYLPAW